MANKFTCHLYLLGCIHCLKIGAMFANCFRNPCNFISKRVNIYEYEGKYIVVVHVFHKTKMEMILAVNSAIIHDLPSLHFYRLRIKDGWERNTG